MITHEKEFTKAQLIEQAKTLGLEVKKKDTNKVLMSMINKKLTLLNTESTASTSPSDLLEDSPESPIHNKTVEDVHEGQSCDSDSGHGAGNVPKVNKGFHPITGKPVH